MENKSWNKDEKLPVRRVSSFHTFLMAFAGLGLIVLVVMITQFSTGSTLRNLQQSSFDATHIFSNNQMLENLLNTTYNIDLEMRRLSLGAYDALKVQKLRDSIAVVKQHAEELSMGISIPAVREQMNPFYKLLSNRLTLMDSLMGLFGGQPSYRGILLLELAQLQDSDEIYAAALALQNSFEYALQQSLITNTRFSEKVLLLTRILSIAAILGIALVGTFLIRRLLQNEQLLIELNQARLRAEHLAEMQDQFVANISHEIRTPIHAITGFAGLLDKQVMPAAQQGYMEQIQASGQVLLTLVNDLLDAASIKAQKLQIRPRIFQFQAVCRQNQFLFKQTAEQKNLALSCHFDEEIPAWLYGDPDRLQQVMMNLVNNALRYTLSGYVSVSMELHQKLPDAIWIKLVVEDSGVGINAEDIERIFEPFEQANDPEKPYTGGTGLGLSIVKNLVELQGGTITLESEKGKGSRFEVLLPYGVVKTPEISGGDTPDATPALTLYAGARVLVVEDNEVNRLLIRQLLAQRGILAQLANNGRAAVDIVHAEQDFDLILLDIQMPELSGPEAALLIKAQGNGHIPMVALSAHPEASFNTRKGAWQPDDYLTKPLQTAELDRVLEQYLAHRAITGNGCFVNESWLMDNFGANHTMIAEILSLFTRQFQSEQTLLREALTARDKENASRICHSMITTAGTINPTGPLPDVLRQLWQVLQTPTIDWTSAGSLFSIFDCYAAHALEQVNAIAVSPSGDTAPH